MGAGRRLAREQQTLTNRRSKRVNIVGRRPKSDVAVISPRVCGGTLVRRDGWEGGRALVAKLARIPSLA